MKTLILIILFLSLFNLTHAKGRIYINVGKASIKKSLLAFPSIQFYGSTNNTTNRQTGVQIYETTKNNLEASALFQFIDPNAYLEDVSKVGLRPAPAATNGFDFKKWATINTEFLIRGGYNVIGENITFEVYLYYVPQAKLILGKKYSGDRQQVRDIAHSFSDDLIEALTGKKSIFKTKIVASIDNGPKTHKEIYIMDWDSHNKQKITSHKSIAISPAWGPDGKKVAYTAYIEHAPKGQPRQRNADLFIYELDTQKRWLVSYRKGINSGAAFLKDGEHMLLTISKGGNPDIYKMTTKGTNLKNLTNGPHGAMNVEPAVSPDGKTIAFSSSRGGKIRLYTMNSNGSNVKLVSSVGKYNATPTWSDDGNMIAFAGYDSKKQAFDIFVTDKSGFTIKRLTSAKKANGKWADNEDPTFSPDGRHIMFVSNRTGKKQLYLISPDGKNERRITYDNYNYSKPKWSPYMD